MKKCKNCSTILEDSFQLGSKCPNCKVRIVYEDSVSTSFFQRLGKTTKTIGSFISVIIVFGLIVFGILSLIGVPFMIVEDNKISEVEWAYFEIVAEIETNLKLDNTAEAVTALEQYILAHKSDFEFFANSGVATEDKDFFIDRSGLIDHFQANLKFPYFVIENEDKFANHEVIGLLNRMGYFSYNANK